MKAPTLAEYVAENGAFTLETVASYKMARSVQIVLTEPWGLKFNAFVVTPSNTSVNINYNGLEEYGAIVYYDTEGKYDSMTAEELMVNEDAYVFSSLNGDAYIDGKYISALYNKVYTYQLNSNAYVMFYVKDADGYHYGKLDTYNAYDLANTRKDAETGFGELEQTVYASMVNMYNSVKAYRDDYFSRNPQ